MPSPPFSSLFSHVLCCAILVDVVNFFPTATSELKNRGEARLRPLRNARLSLIHRRPLGSVQMRSTAACSQQQRSHVRVAVQTGPVQARVAVRVRMLRALHKE